MEVSGWFWNSCMVRQHVETGPHPQQAEDTPPPESNTGAWEPHSQPGGQAAHRQEVQVTQVPVCFSQPWQSTWASYSTDLFLCLLLSPIGKTVASGPVGLP